jgi:hypothetical protein
MTHLSRKYLWTMILLALLPALMLWGAARLYRATLLAAAGNDKTRSASRAHVQQAHPQGWVVFARQGGIWLQRLGEAEARRVADQGSYPRFAPHGRRIAFVRGKTVAVVNRDGSGLRELVAVAEPQAVGWAPDGRRVLFSDGQKIKQVELSGGPPEPVVRGYTFRELDLTPDGRRLVASVRGAFGVKVLIFDLPGPTEGREFAEGCSASFSPDGHLVTVNDGRHQRLNFHEAASGVRRGGIDAPPGLRFDNQFWSNHADWIVSLAEGDGGNVFIHQVSANRSLQVTSGGGCDRPDLFVEAP